MGCCRISKCAPAGCKVSPYLGADTNIGMPAVSSRSTNVQVLVNNHELRIDNLSLAGSDSDEPQLSQLAGTIRRIIHDLASKIVNMCTGTVRDQQAAVEWDAVSSIMSGRRDSIALSDKVITELLRVGSGNVADKGKAGPTLRVTDNEAVRRSFLSCTPRSQFGPCLDDEDSNNGAAGSPNDTSGMPNVAGQGQEQ